MILVDSSAWVDYFRGIQLAQIEKLDVLLGIEPLVIGDLVLTKVLQGFITDRDFNQAKQVLMSLTVVEIGGQDIAIQAAQNYRFLRTMGITVRKTIDTLIATWCIEKSYILLHNDRDFEAFMTHLSLCTVIEEV